MKGDTVGINTALADEVAVRHPGIAGKLRALGRLYDTIGAEGRPMTTAERAIQVANTLTAKETEAAQAVEWGTYVAVENIAAESGAWAYTVGHPVTVSNVDAHGYLIAGLVERVTPPDADTDTDTDTDPED